MKTVRFKSHERPYYSDTEIERIAQEELQAAGLMPQSPGKVRIERFVEKRFVSPQYEDLPSGLLGYTEFGPRGVVAILISRALAEEDTLVAERRINSTLAHEGGHGLLHAHLFALDSFPDDLFGSTDDVTPSRILCRDEPATPSKKRYDGRWWELQANRMIGALLMPQPLVRQALEPLMAIDGSLGLAVLRGDRREVAVRELVSIFEVNPAAARIRIDQMFPDGGSPQLTL